MKKREEEIRTQARKNFSNHQATVRINMNDILVIDWRNKDGCSDHYVQYMVDKSSGLLTISGDLGDCISCWYNKISISGLVGCVQNIDYWMEKFQAVSNSDDFTYKPSDIEEDVNAIRKEYLENKEDYLIEDKSDAEINEDFDELLCILMEYGVGNYPYPPDAVEIIEKYNEEWWDGGEFLTIGKRVSDRVYLWSEGLKMAYAQISEEIE